MERRRVCIYGQRDIVKHDVEPRCSPRQVFPDQSSDHLSLRNQLAGVELRCDALENFVDDGGEHPLIVVCAQCTVYLGQSLDSWTRENTAGDVDHLQVFGAGEGGDVAWFGAHVVGDGGFEPGDAEMRAWEKGTISL